MSFKQVTSLRKSGMLREAYDMAKADLEQEQSEWTYSAMFWVIRDYCKQYIANEQKAHAEECLEKMQSLLQNMNDFEGLAFKAVIALQKQLTPHWDIVGEMSELSKNGEVENSFETLWEIHKTDTLSHLLHEDFGWVIYRYLSKHSQEIGSYNTRKVLYTYINLENERPSLLHSQFLSFALNYSKYDESFKLLPFLKLWGPENLRTEDFNDSNVDGKSIPSLMSRIARSIVNYPWTEVQEFVDLLPMRKEQFIDMLKEHFFWNIYHSMEEGVTVHTWELFDQYLDFFPDAPGSSPHSKVLGLAERVMKDNNMTRFYHFFHKWNPEKLRTEDWEEEKGGNGEIYKPLAIKSMNKAIDALETLSNDQIVDLCWLIKLLDSAIEKYPNDDWLFRSKAILYMRAGQLNEAKDIYKNLCLKMGEKYYIWHELSHCCDDNNICIALLCKALSLEKNEDYVGKIRLELAKLLIKCQKYENASVELNLYKKHYSEKGWRIDPEIDILLSQCLSVTSRLQDNKNLYLDNIPIAEEYAYSDIPFVEVVLVDEWKNDKGKSMLTFVNADAIEFTVNKNRFQILKDCHIGQVWFFKLYKEEITHTIPSQYSWQPSKTEMQTKYIPLIATASELADWQILPEKYGYVHYVNTEKKVYHIYSTESILFCEHYKNQTLIKGDFVKFRQFQKKVKDDTKVFFKDIHKCERIEAITHFKKRIVAVDDVNAHRQLFHFVLGPKRISGILHYNQTELRPSVGDCISIRYFVRKIEDKYNPRHIKKVLEVVQCDTTDEINQELFRLIEGLLEVKYRDGNEYGNPDFAFIGDFYVHKNILERYKISSDCRVQAKVIYSGDDKWKVFEITKREETE